MNTTEMVVSYNDTWLRVSGGGKSVKISARYVWDVRHTLFRVSVWDAGILPGLATYLIPSEAVEGVWASIEALGGQE